jgi:hypothetical protein
MTLASLVRIYIIWKLHHISYPYYNHMDLYIYIYIYTPTHVNTVTEKLTLESALKEFHFNSYFVVEYWQRINSLLP